MRRILVGGGLLATACLLSPGCGGGGSGGGSTAAAVTSATPTPMAFSVSTPPAPAGPDHAALLAAYEARRQAYLQACVAGFGGQGENDLVQLARLELGVGPISRRAIEDSLDFLDRRPDTADFRATTLIRLAYLHGTDPLLPVDLQQRLERSLVGFKYWLDEPGQDDLVYWSENHQIMFASCEYLAGQRWPTATFPNDGRTGDAHRRDGLRRVQRWLEERLRWGVVEWCSPVYLPHTIAPLLNLVDFAQDFEVQTRAAMVLDQIVYDLARRTHRGSFGVTAGRAYQEHKLSGRGQSVGDTIELLFGTRGQFQSRGGTAGTPLATSRRYKVPSALLSLGVDDLSTGPARVVDRARSGLSFAEGPAAGRGFSTHDDVMFWWGCGAYAAQPTVQQTKKMMDDWGLWSNAGLSVLAPLRSVPDFLLQTAVSTIGPVTDGPILAPANSYVFRTPDVMLSSVQSFRPGQTGFQQHAWQATLGMDALVFTTAPGNLGHDGPTEWTGSASLPRVIQVEDTLVALYRPGTLQKALFPQLTHAFFPKAAFDEIVEQGGWTCGRKGDGYVALFSARPTGWAQLGPYADEELFASGADDAWVCVVGRAAEDGSFADFVARLAASPPVTTGLGGGALQVVFQAPGLGQLVVPWSGDATLNGAALQDRDFPLHDDPWATQAWADPIFEMRHGGAVLRHDGRSGVRTGDGL